MAKKFGDDGSGGPNSDNDDQFMSSSGPGMGPNCNLKSMFRADSEALNSGKNPNGVSYGQN